MEVARTVFSFLVVAVIIFILGHASAIHGTAPEIKLIKQANEFTEAYNSWARRCNTLSPHSLDYWETIAEVWYRKEIGEKFRKLEGAVKGE